MKCHDINLYQHAAAEAEVEAEAEAEAAAAFAVRNGFTSPCGFKVYLVEFQCISLRQVSMSQA